MGAVFRRPIYSGTPEELAALLHRSGLPLYGAALREDTVDARQADYTRCTLAIGSEGRGLSPGGTGPVRPNHPHPHVGPLRISECSHCRSGAAVGKLAIRRDLTWLL